MNLAQHRSWENTSLYKILKPTQKKNCKLVNSIAIQVALLVLLHDNLYNTLHDKVATTPPIVIKCLQLLYANETFVEYILHSIFALSFKFLLKTFHDHFLQRILQVFIITPLIKRALEIIFTQCCLCHWHCQGYKVVISLFIVILIYIDMLFSPWHNDFEFLLCMQPTFSARFPMTFTRLAIREVCICGTQARTTSPSFQMHTPSCCDAI